VVLFSVVDLACGPGGFSEGYRLATGSSQVLGVDFSEVARSSYAAAGFTPIHGDLFRPDECARLILDACGGRPDWVIGSSSCKAWTPAGQRKGAADDRDTLLAWLEVVGKVAPRLGAVMENVKQAASHPDWGVGLARVGMPMVAQWTLKAYLYGAPTKRERSFWMWSNDNRWPMKPSVDPVPVKYASICSNSGGQFGIRRLPENTHIFCRVDAPQVAKFAARWTILTVGEALEAQGCPGKVILGSPKERAQQIADMVPPPLAAAVIRAVMRTSTLEASV
jgi:site-specific DNA-cytosine methylase